MTEAASAATAAILAGGRSSRFGANKALALLDGKRLVARAADALRGHFARVILIAEDAEPYAFLGLPCFPDRIPGLGPLGGVLTALRATQHPWVFVAGCDMPLLDGGLARAIVAAARETDQAVIPRVGGRLHPLHAAYRYDLTHALEVRRVAGERALHRILESVPRREVSEDEIRAWGYSTESLANVNTPEELRALTRR